MVCNSASQVSATSQRLEAPACAARGCMGSMPHLILHNQRLLHRVQQDGPWPDLH
jgi:hypothetical protein